MKKTLSDSLRVLLLLLTSLTSLAQVGIGTATPNAFFNVAQNRTVLFGQDTTGDGNKLIWYGLKAAIRAGKVDDYSWHLDNVGVYSFATGYNTKASGWASVAMGLSSQATREFALASGEKAVANGYASTAIGSHAVANGDYSVALGNGTASSNFSFAVGDNSQALGVGATALGRSTASGTYATSLGELSTASGDYSTAIGRSCVSSGPASSAIGYQAVASNSNSVALGANTSASGSASTAMGFSTMASAIFATAMGYKTTASGAHSTAMGANVSTNRQPGSFIIGSPGRDYTNSTERQMMMRFPGGYIFYSSSPENQTDAVGVQLVANGNAWSVISDSTRKENFRQVDGALFLQKIANMRLGSWNYKGQDAKQYRHYGPMAQDFFAAFGHDELGTIGEDKSINQADFDGVNLIAIQALVQKIEKLESENSALRTQNTSIENETASLKSDMAQLKKQMASLLKQ